MIPERNQMLSYDEEHQLRALLAEEAKRDGLHAPKHVETALLGELRRRKRVGLITRVACAGAIAASLMIGLALTRPHEPAAPPLPLPRLAVSAPVPEALVIAKNEDPATAHGTRPSRRSAAQAVGPKAPPDNREGEFIPLGAWQAIEPMERGSIIRVRMPKAVLPGLGIPVSADRWNEYIPADVVLGEDGSMRAVRLVSLRQ